MKALPGVAPLLQRVQKRELIDVRAAIAVEHSSMSAPVHLFRFGSRKSKTFFGFGGQVCKSHSMIVVITGGLGHGSAHPTTHKTGKATTCKLSATRKASNNGIVSVRK